MVMSPGFPEYLYGQDGRREVLSEAGALYRLAWKCRDGRKMVDYFGGSARKISKNQLDMECKRKRKEQMGPCHKQLSSRGVSSWHESLGGADLEGVQCKMLMRLL